MAASPGEKTHGNYARMLPTVLNKFWKHPLPKAKKKKRKDPAPPKKQPSSCTASYVRNHLSKRKKTCRPLLKIHKRISSVGSYKWTNQYWLTILVQTLDALKRTCQEQ